MRSAIFKWVIPAICFLSFSAIAQEKDKETKYQECLSLAEANPATAYEEGAEWAGLGGGLLAQHCMGVAQLRKGELRQAAMRLEYVATELPKFRHDMDITDRTDIMRQAAKAWAENKDFKESYRVLTAALALNENDPQILTDRARVQMDQGRLWESIDDLNILIDQRYDSITTYTLRGKAYRLLEQYDVAFTDIEIALRQNHHYVPALLELGFIYEVRKDIPKARDAFLAASLAAPNTPEADRAQMEFQRLVSDAAKD